MRNRVAFWVVGTMLLLAPLMVEQTQAQVAGPEIGMGFGPGSVRPVSMGTPIYAIPDRVWVVSYYDHEITANLTSPAGSLKAVSLLEPGVPVAVYTFGFNDTPGTWQLSVLVDGAWLSQRFRVGTSDGTLIPSLIGSTLSNGYLVQEFSLPKTNVTDIEACGLGASPSPFVRVAVPSSLASEMLVRLENSTAVVSISKVLRPFVTWTELYSKFSFQNSRAVITEDLLVGSTTAQTVVVSTSSNLSESATEVLPFRTGRYTMRTFFRSASGLLVTENELLLRSGGRWFSLSECESLVAVSGQTFALRTDLNQSASAWPVRMYTMFSSGGVEGYSTEPITEVASTVDLVPALPNAPFYGFEALASGRYLQDSEFSGGSLYLVGTRYPLDVTIRMVFSNVTTRSVNFTVPSPNTRNPMILETGVLVASLTVQGKIDNNATFEVSAPGNPPALLKPTTNGILELLLPPGNYTVRATKGGETASASVELKQGGVTSAELELGGGPASVLLYGLLAVGLVGIAANAFVWRRFIRLRKQS